MKRLFNYIARKAKRRIAFEKSEEFRFFLNNRHLFNKMPLFQYLYDYNKDPFMVMRANIVLKAYLNKAEMEQAINNLAKSDNLLNQYQEIISKLPYYQEKDNKIYIPFFSHSLNQIYAKEPEKLLTSPYNGLVDNFIDTLIDPFDKYGNELFNSSFTRLIKIKSDEKETAYFHKDTNTIYFVNDQGRLDTCVVLFDKYIKHPNYENILERIVPVVDAYFAFDRNAFIKNLYENGFISSHLLHLIKFKGWAK